MRINYRCDYCGHKFHVYSYYVDSVSEDNCPKCKTKMTIKNVTPEKDSDVYGYNRKEVKEKITEKIDYYKKK